MRTEKESEGNVNSKDKPSGQSFSMLRILTSCFFLFVIASYLINAQSENNTEGLNGNLVDVYWLEKNLKNENILIIDASPDQIYTAKHISGAINYDIFSYGPQELPDGEIEKRYQSWGISPGKKIVIYDQGGTFLATRFFFSLYYYGFPVEDLFILDGGLSKWLDVGLPITIEKTPTIKKGTFTINKINEEVAPELPEFITASGNTGSNVLLEALDPDWHFGGLTFFDKPGHIPNAIMTPSTDYFNPDKTFKSPEEIRKMMTYLGVRKDQQIYTHCGGGIAASVPFFALKFILDYPKVKLYRGSQLEWVSDQRELPMWTYDAPYIMRETQWLKFWGGKTARMYGISNVTILDVRSEREFYEGHIPFAINIPSDLFNSNITNPGKLAEILGQFGVNASDEAVVISGSGLTKESALAFVMLEKLGQKKVSIYLDARDKWTELGLTVIKDTAVVDPKKVSGVLSNQATTYPVNLRKDVIFEDANTTKGLYPKVFIASGEKAPLKVANEKVIHIPYTALINADGTPKEAKEIWKILNKSEVPRYAELVCISEEPGEAAINYFILKLMGYPDIKVLVM